MLIRTKFEGFSGDGARRLHWGDDNPAPQAPDPKEVSAAQTTSNLETARANAQLNRVNQNTPWGSLTYSRTPQAATFNQTGYDKAMAEWQAKQPATQPASQTTASGAPSYGAGASGSGYGEGGESGGGGSTYNTGLNSPPVGTAPTRDQFMTSGGEDQWTADVKLTPEQQALLNQDNRIKTQVGNIAESGLGRVNTAMNTPFSTEGMTAYRDVPQGGGAGAFDPSGLGQYQTSAGSQFNMTNQGPSTAGISGRGGSTAGIYSQGPSTEGIRNQGPATSGIQSQGPSTEGIQRTVGSDMQIQQQLRGSDIGIRSQLSGADDFSTDRTRVEDALYSRLNPQLQRDRQMLDQKLANQGIMQGSEAYNTAVDESNRAATDARMQAILAGGQEQSRLFGMDVQAGQFQNQAQAQDFGQGAVEGEFANRAAGQDFNQNLSTADFVNRAQAQRYGQEANNIGINNSAQQQQFAQQFSNAQLENAAQQQRYAQQFGNTQLSNSAQQQLYAQQTGNTRLGNEAQQQRYTQEKGNREFANATQAQDFAQNKSNVELANATRAAQFAEGTTTAQQANQANQQNFSQTSQAAEAAARQRQQQIQEEAFKRQLPLNELNALRTGSQVTAPQFSATPQTNVAPTNTSGDIWNSYNGQVSGANAQQASSNQMTGGLMSLAATAAMVF